MHRTIWHCTLSGCEITALPGLTHVLPCCSRDHDHFEVPPALPRPRPCGAAGLLVAWLGRGITMYALVLASTSNCTMCVPWYKEKRGEADARHPEISDH